MSRVDIQASPIVARVTGIPVNASVAQIDELAEAVNSDLAAAKAEHGRLTEGRRKVLLSGDDAAAEAHDARIAAEARRQDRAEALLEEIAEKRVAAAAREECARLDDLVRQADKTAKELTAALQAEYAVHAAALAAFLTCWKDGHAVIDAANRELRAAGRAIVDSPEKMLRSKPSKQMPDTFVERETWMIDGKPIGPATYIRHHRTGEMVSAQAGAEKGIVRETVRGPLISSVVLSPLDQAVNLPPISVDDVAIWPAR